MHRSDPAAPTHRAPAQTATGTAPVARLRLKVQSANGQAQTLEFSNTTEAEAMRRAASRGFRVLSIESGIQASHTKSSSRKIQFPILLFTQELLALLEAGLNLSEALTTLHNKEREPATKAIMADVLQTLREGRNFSDVLAQLPQHFPDVYVATIRASERTGDMPQALKRYITYQAQFDVIRKKLVSASIYPVMLLVVGGFVTLFLMGYVVPRFSSVYENSGKEKPWLSELMLLFGNLIYQNWQIALAVIVGSICLFIWAVRQPEGRAWMLDKMLRLPWLAAKTNEFRLARFYRSVSLLLAAGISLPRAIGMVGGMLGSHQQANLAACRQAVEQGHSLSDALASSGLSTPVADSLIKVGERSGQMSEMLERTARFADEDFARWVDWASRLLEPILMTLIGIVIGTVVVLMYLPIFDLAGSLQ